MCLQISVIFRDCAMRQHIGYVVLAILTFVQLKNYSHFFYIQNIPLSTRIHGEPFEIRCCNRYQLQWCFLTGLMFCWAGLTLFRTSLRGLLCCLGPRLMLSHHNMGSKSGKITDKIVVFHGFWLIIFCPNFWWPGYDLKMFWGFFRGVEFNGLGV